MSGTKSERPRRMLKVAEASEEAKLTPVARRVSERRKTP